MPDSWMVLVRYVVERVLGNVSGAPRACLLHESQCSRALQFGIDADNPECPIQAARRRRRQLPVLKPDRMVSTSIHDGKQTITTNLV